mgnify:CR=1 FL=1
MPKIVQIGMGGSDVASPPTELTTNLDPALLFEDGTTGDDFIEIDTTTSAEKLILAAGGAKTGIGASPEFCADKGLHIQTGDSAATSSDVHADADDLIVEGSGNSGISILTPTNGKGCLYFIDENTGGTPDGIAFDQGTGSLRFQVANSERLRIQNDSVIRIFDGGKLSTGSESSPICASNGIHIKEDDTGIGSANTHADMLVIEANTHPGLSFLSNNTSRNTIAFGDPQSSMAGELRYTHGGGSNADMFFLLMQNSVAINVDHDHKLGVNHQCVDSSAQLTVKGNLTADLSGTFTATNGDATLSSGSSTAFTTELVPGSAIEIFESGTSRGVFTVSSITSATELELDSTVSGLSSSPKTGMTGKTDAGLLDIQTGDSQTALKIPKPGRFEVLQVSSLKYTNLIIGDSTTGEDLTTGFQNIFIGCGAGKENTLNAGIIAIGHEAGSYGISSDGGVYIGFRNRGASGGKTVAVGRDAGSESGGQLSVCVGFRAGRVSAAGHSAYFGQYSTMLGANTRPASNNDENSIAVGYDVTGHGANTAVIGNSSVTQIDPSSDRGCNLGQVSYEFDAVHCVSVTEVSDERLKEQIEDTTLGVDFIKRLRPVSYKFKDRAAEYETGTQTIRNENGEEVEEPVQILKQPALTHTRKHQGLIAQEVKQVLDDIGMDSADFGGYVDGNISGNGDRYALRYQQFISPLIKAVQELSATVETLQTRIEVLENGD